LDISGQDNGVTLNSSYQFSNNLEADFGISAILNSQIDNDILIRAGLKMLFASSSSGAAISVEKGSEFQKVIATIVKGYEGGKIKLSVAQLKKIMGINFSDFT